MTRMPGLQSRGGSTTSRAPAARCFSACPSMEEQSPRQTERAGLRRRQYGQSVMVRPWRLIAQVAVLGAVMLAFPSAGSALPGFYVITLTPNGPSPLVATLTAGADNGVPSWINSDSVPHTVVFANGLCSLQLAPGQAGNCTNAFFWEYVGNYPYTVDGTTPASVVVTPLFRTVTLTARSHTIRQGAHLLLHGTLAYGTGGYTPPGLYSDMPVIVLARHDRHHAFQRIAMAAEPGERQSSGYPWQLYVHPTTTTIYIAEATEQPPADQFWTNATSKPFRVVVRRVKG